MSENKGAKRPRIGQKKEHKEIFMQDKYFNIHHRDGDDEVRNENKPRGENRKFGRKFSDDGPSERKFGMRRFDDDNRGNRSGRRFDDEDSRRFDRKDRRPDRRKFDDDAFEHRNSRNDRPNKRGRRFNDDDNDNRRRFTRDNDRPYGRRFNDEEHARPSRRRFNDDDNDRPRRRFNDDDNGRTSRFSREKDGKKSYSSRESRPNDRKYGKKHYDDDKPIFERGDKTRRNFDDDDKRGSKRKSTVDTNEETPRHGRKGYQREKDPLYDRPKAFGEIRLNKYLADSGICSRREADELIKAGCVTVNGEVITTMGFKVKPEDKVVYGGQTLSREKLRYILLNKPKGYITTSDDPYERDTVIDLVKDACNERIFPVGRLDRLTTGLLLFTNDGDLAKRLTHPSSEVAKLYHVTLDKPLTKNDMLRISEGITLDDGDIAPDAISYVEGDSTKKEIGIELHSGRNRIVRRIFEHLGYEVTKLDRVMFAGLDKYKLPRGEWRFLTDMEVNMLKKI